MEWVARILVAACTSAIGGGITIYFGLNYKVAAMLEIAANGQNILAITLVIAGTMGLISLIIYSNLSTLRRLTFQSPITFNKKRAEPEAIRINTNGIEFFPTTESLGKAHPLSETFRAGNELHALLLSGEGAFEVNMEYIKCVKRLILPEPHDGNLERLGHLKSGIDFRSQIMRYATFARQNNPYSLRFCRDFLGVSLLFCNPNSQNAWVQIGIILPETESAERPHFRIYKSGDEQAFLSLYKTFDGIWNTSSEQTEQEAFEEGFREGFH